MNIKTILCVATAALSASLMATDTPEVSNVVMTQANFGRKVTITYDLGNAANGAVVTLDIETNKTGAATSVAAKVAVANIRNLYRHMASSPVVLSP